MGIHVILFWLLLTAAFGKSDLGTVGVVMACIGLVGLVAGLVGALQRPSRRLLWLLLPLAVVHAYLQIVGVWSIGIRHETITLSLYGLTLLAALGIAAWTGRASRLAVAGGVAFLAVYGWFAFEVSLFVFWTGLH